MVRRERGLHPFRFDAELRGRGLRIDLQRAVPAKDEARALRPALFQNGPHEPIDESVPNDLLRDRLRRFRHCHPIELLWRQRERRRRSRGRRLDEVWTALVDVADFPDGAPG